MEKLTPKIMGLAAIVIAIAVVTLWVTEESWRPAAVVPYKDAYETATLSFSDERSGAILNPVVTLTGVSVSYGPIMKTASGGAAEFTSVPRGIYKVEAVLAGFYEYEVIGHTIESKLDTYSEGFTLDNIGTFGWAETAASANITEDNDQIVILRLYLNNTAKDTVIQDLRTKLITVVGAHENITYEDVECTSHIFEEDDLTAEKWIISGHTVGDVEGQETITVTYRVTLDIDDTSGDATGNTLVFTASVQDLNGTSPETSASKTITWTVA